MLLSEWAIVRKGIQFVQQLCCLSGMVTGGGACMHVAFFPFFCVRWSDSNKCLSAGEQIELWDMRGMAAIHYFIFTQHQTLFTQMVRRIRWCMARLSRSQLNELISASTKAAGLVWITLCFCPHPSRWQGRRLMATPALKFLKISWKLNNNL